MKPQNQTVIDGRRLVVAIEKLALQKLREAKSQQNTRFDTAIREQAFEWGISELDLMALFRKLQPRFSKASRN